MASSDQGEFSLRLARQQWVVTAEQMLSIESRMFAAGFPIAALMEKVASRITARIIQLYPDPSQSSIGILIGPGHNGGDALVIARELHWQGYRVQLFVPFQELKPLTAAHAEYVQSIGIPISPHLVSLQHCQVLVDGLFGFGLQRQLTGAIATTVDTINSWGKTVLSLDLPSGLHTDTGAVMGTAIQATRTFCLGLWKLGLLQEQALPWVGIAELIDFDIPLADIRAILGSEPPIQRIIPNVAIAQLPLHRPITTHKYQMGHALLITGSQQYAGAALLAGFGARASGVGMLTLAVPASLKPMITASLPEALVLACAESEFGVIQGSDTLIQQILPEKYTAIACGPGLTIESQALIAALLPVQIPLLLDADALTIIATHQWQDLLKARSAPTVLTPHWGEFKRLFPQPVATISNRVDLVRHVAKEMGCFILLKGARTLISNPQGQLWINPESTPALARGGSGDVLSGLLVGLMAQAIAQDQQITAPLIAAAAWWHAQAGIEAEQHRTVLGVDAFTLSQFLAPTLQAANSKRNH